MEYFNRTDEQSAKLIMRNIKCLCHKNTWRSWR